MCLNNVRNQACIFTFLWYFVFCAFYCVRLCILYAFIVYVCTPLLPLGIIKDNNNRGLHYRLESLHLWSSSHVRRISSAWWCSLRSFGMSGLCNRKCEWKRYRKQNFHRASDVFVFITGLITRTLGPSNDFTLLNGCTGKCVRLSRLLAFECTLNHCTFIHSYYTTCIFIYNCTLYTVGHSHGQRRWAKLMD